MKGNLEQLGEKAQKRAIQLNIEGLTHQAVADKLNEEFKGNLSSSDVASFISRQKNKSLDFLKSDKKYQEKLVDEYFNTVQQLKEVNSQLWEFFYELRKNPEYKDKIITCPKCKHRLTLNMQSYGLLLKTADTILRQIEHVDRVIGKLKSSSSNITYNFVDLSKKLAIAVPQMLHQMEQRGIVKVNKKRLKLYQGGKKQEYREEDDYEEEEDDEDDR